MSARRTSRVVQCLPAEARARRSQARAFLDVADIISTDQARRRRLTSLLPWLSLQRSLPQTPSAASASAPEDADGDLVFVGPEAERRYGQRHFLELLSVFTAALQFAVVHGRREIGSVDPFVLVRKVNGPRVIASGGRGWLVTAVDWPHRRAHVEPADQRGAARWTSIASPQAFVLVQAQRRVLLGTLPTGVELTERALRALARAREESSASSTRTARWSS